MGELAVSVANHLHGELMEAAHRVLPTCPAHDCGLHISLTTTGPAWLGGLSGSAWRRAAWLAASRSNHGEV